MINKSNCMSILLKLEDKGLNIDQYMKKLLVAKEPPLDVLKFISKNRGIEVANFYEMLRKNHNLKKSPLYTNILKEQIEQEDVILTLNCLLTQILLYNKKLQNNTTFLQEVRANEIATVLAEYFNSLNATDCFKLLKLIKSDILVLEYIAERRDLQ